MASRWRWAGRGWRSLTICRRRHRAVCTVARLTAGKKESATTWRKGRYEIRTRNHQGARGKSCLDPWGPQTMMSLCAGLIQDVQRLGTGRQEVSSVTAGVLIGGKGCEWCGTTSKLCVAGAGIRTGVA